jgi:hypothetical protein
MDGFFGPSFYDLSYIVYDLSYSAGPVLTGKGQWHLPGGVKMTCNRLLQNTRVGQKIAISLKATDRICPLFFFREAPWTKGKYLLSGTVLPSTPTPTPLCLHLLQHQHRTLTPRSTSCYKVGRGEFKCEGIRLWRQEHQDAGLLPEAASARD